MYVSSKMSRNIVSVFPEASISLAFRLLREQHVRQLPVVDNGKLVGMVTEALLNEVSPSKATSLSIYELNYILEKTKVADIMEKNVVTCGEDMSIEQVALLMNENDINMVPVVDSQTMIKGIITRNDIIASFLDILGSRGKGSRIILIGKDEPGTLANISKLLSERQYNIVHIINFPTDNPNESEIIIRLDSVANTELLQELENNGFKVEKHTN
ncbi:MAG: CBS and ACT domain-containing protein [Eubacteriales bacterium]|nr:CBS and ACT domain-containing protein [Eubacteriales bacterium]